VIEQVVVAALPKQLDAFRIIGFVETDHDLNDAIVSGNAPASTARENRRHGAK
jgi:hypothetical protein